MTDVNKIEKVNWSATDVIAFVTNFSVWTKKCDFLWIINNLVMPSISPSVLPTSTPSAFPTLIPSVTPTEKPSFSPTKVPTFFPTTLPSALPTLLPSIYPSKLPSFIPTGNTSKFMFNFFSNSFQIHELSVFTIFQRKRLSMFEFCDIFTEWCTPM